MTRRQYHVALVVLAVSGLLGGAIGGSWLGEVLPRARQASVAQQVRAGQFVLVDSTGETRAVLGIEPANGQSMLRLFDAAGNVRVVLSGSALHLLREAGEGGARLDLCDGLVSLDLASGVGQACAVVDFPAGEPRVWLRDSTGRVRWHAP